MLTLTCNIESEVPRLYIYNIVDCPNTSVASNTHLILKQYANCNAANDAQQMFSPFNLGDRGSSQIIQSGEVPPSHRRLNISCIYLMHHGAGYQGTSLDSPWKVVTNELWQQI